MKLPQELETPSRIALEVSGTMRSRPTGIAVYGRGLIRALAERSPGRYELVHPFTRWLKRRWLGGELSELPRRAYAAGRGLSARCSLLHALDTRVPRAYDGPLVATIFDVLSAMPESARMGFATRAFREKKLESYRRIARSADAIICPSEATCAAFVRCFEPAGATHVIPPGVALPATLPEAEAREELARFGIQPPFALTVGALCPRKNVEAAVRTALAAKDVLPELKLVLVGEPLRGWEGSEGERAVAAAREDVIATGYLPQRTLQAAYRMAAALVHLSHHEGYGLTVVEALASGTPVLASDRGGIPEAAGGAAWLVDPNDTDAAASRLRQILAGSRDVETLRRRGLEHARSLAWGSVAGRIEQVYHEVLRR